MCEESKHARADEKTLFSSLLNLPFFKEMEAYDEPQDQDDDQPDALSIQRALIDYFLNLPAFREIEGTDEKNQKDK